MSMPYLAIASATLLRSITAVVGQRLQRGQGHPAAIDLEEVAQRLARVRTAEAVGAERDVAAVEEGTDLFGEQADVVGGGDDRAARIVEQFSTCDRRGFSAG
jgi:hypothetical protein